MTEILFRADGGPGIGAGHLSRCLALAQACRQRGWRCTLLTLAGSTPLHGWRDIEVRSLPELDPGSAQDLQATAAQVKELGAAWVVADGYRFSVEYLARLDAQTQLLVLDDLGERDPACRVMLNPNPGAESRHAGHYRQAREVLLGTEYFLLRPEIRGAQASPERQRVLVTFGGDDDENLALAFVSLAAEQGLDIHADVICTVAGVGLAQLRQVAGRAPGHWQVHAGPLEIAPFMARASVMICAGGTTACEAASLGIPCVIVVRADNQRPGAQALMDLGAASVAGEGAAALPVALAMLKELLADGRRREDMGCRGRALVDGRGAERVAARMEERL